MEAYAGIDLHSSSNFTAVIDDKDRRLFAKKLPNRLDSVLSALRPFEGSLQGVVIESTYNWYWLVDGLQEHGYRVHLANPSAIKQYEGLKHTDDKWDSFWLAHMLRLGILPEGYIYPKEDRPLRDLLRRRLLFVRHRTAHILSLQSMVSRNLGKKISVNNIKKLEESDAERMFDSPYLVLAARNNIGAIRFLTGKIRQMEREARMALELRDEFRCLLTIPGIGLILGLTIMLEVGDIRRFSKASHYYSYCRCVKSERLSNDKKKAENNRKNGNRYLAWAYVEAANFAVRYCPYAQGFYQRKRSKSNGVVAIKALSNKLAKASYFIMRDQVPYEAKKLFKQ
ncbi:MAG: IS110 family transposase [Deltaproteobacteria bacterium]|nr:IS110 family transposase [Deltaproteobacteria bacterium]